MTTIPTLQQLYADALADLQSEYGVTIPLIGPVFLRAVAAWQAGKLKLFYLSLGSVQKDVTPDTASPAWLVHFGLVKINRGPFPASQGQYTATVTGTTGAVIPAQTEFKSDDADRNPGNLFILDTPYTMPGSTGTITIRALTAGTAARLFAAETLTATSPLNNVNDGITVVAETIAPTDAEDIELYRAKVVESYQLLPQGGAAVDYRLWGKESIAGVQQIYPYTKTGAANEENIYIEATVADSTDGKGTPSATIITNVTNAVEAKRPMGVFLVHYLPVVIKPVKINIAGSTFTTAQKALILTALTEAIALIRPFIAGADVVANRKDVLNLNKISFTVLSTIPGSVFGAVTLYIPDSPPVSVSSYQFDNGEIPWLDQITYIP